MSAGEMVITPASRRKPRDTWRLVGNVFLIVLTAFSAIPMLWMLLTSVKGQFAALQYPPQWIPTSHSVTSSISPLEAMVLRCT